MMKHKRMIWAILGTLAAGLGGCATHNNTFIQAPHNNVDQALAPGQWGLRKLSPGEYPNMEAAFMDKTGLITAINRSLKFLNSASSKKFFPDGPITHRQEVNSLMDFKYMVQTIQSPQQFQQMILSRYDVYIAKGYDNKGSVWYTGYYTPILNGSLTETSVYQYPVYKRPADLVSNQITGAILGQKQSDGSYKPYPTRREILAGHMLAGHELVWFATPLDAYVAEIQGSAKVDLTNGQVMTIGYAGDNGRKYKGLGQALVASGAIHRRELSLPAIYAYNQQHPNQVEADILKNHFMAFLTVYDPAHWPLGSLGVKVTAHRSLATDKSIEAPPYQSIFPRGAMTFVSAKMPDINGNIQPYTGFLLDQDTGGAIRAAGRADIYMGIGPQAGAQAGYELSKGKLYYLFLKPGLNVMGGQSSQAIGNGNYSGPSAPAPQTGPATPPANTTPMQEMFPGSR